MSGTFHTPREIAEAAAGRGIAGFPTTERGVRMLAEREGWNHLPEDLCRPRRETGGRPSREYHVSLLPEALALALATRALARVEANALALAEEADRRRLAALEERSLSAHRAAAADARAEVLLAIDGFAIARGQSRAWAIARFLEAQAEARARQDAEARRERGAILTAAETAALARPLVLTAAEGFGLPRARLAAANDRRSDAAISRSTLYAWFKARDAAAPGAARLALAPELTRARAPIPEGFREFLKFYARPSKPSAAAAWEEYVAAAARREGAQHMTLTLGQVRTILRTRLNAIERHVGREGLLTLRSRLAYVARTTEDMWPATIYTADGKTFDAEVADPVTGRPIRPEITTVLDVVTRKVVGVSFGRSENQRLVAEALRRACCDHGIPAIFYVDRGPGFRNQALDADVGGLMGRLGIAKMHAAPYGAQAKGRIERPQATIWDRFAKTLPTYIGADMDREAGHKVHRLTRQELKAFGRSPRLLSWDEFLRLALDAAAAYNARPHRGLPKFEDPETGRRRHMSPDEAWAAHEAQGFQAMRVEPEEADDLFRPYESRTVRRALVSWRGNTYFHQALEAWHERRVMVGYDYAQADRVWVREFDVETGQPGPLICVARFAGNAERYVAVSYEQRAVEQRAQGRLRRIEEKRIAAEAERDGALLLEAEALEPATLLEEALARQEPAPEPVHAVPDVPAAAPRRRVFGSDEELAVWALDHPGEVTPRQAEALRRCLASPAGRDLLRMAGIDAQALSALLHRIAA